MVLHSPDDLPESACTSVCVCLCGLVVVCVYLGIGVSVDLCVEVCVCVCGNECDGYPESASKELTPSLPTGKICFSR